MTDRESTHIDGIEITPEVAERTWGTLPDTPGWNALREDMERDYNAAMDTWRADRQAEKEHADAIAYDRIYQQHLQRAFATNHDAGKLRLDLVPPEWFIALGEVMTAGVPEYGDRNWEKGMKWSRHLGSLLRHLVKWMGGEVHDPRTGLHHLKHVAWRALALVSYAEWGVGENDLPMRWR